MLKHISLAIIAIVCAACVTEVGLRANRLYQRFEGRTACTFSPHPCSVTFHQLSPCSQITRTDPLTGQSIVIRTNSLGLRGAHVAAPKPAGTYRVVCLGDDATFAAQILEEETFPELVRANLMRESGRTVEVVNAGIPGYCPLISLVWARQRLAALQPDLVILCCDPSDVADDHRVRPLAKYADDGTLESVSHPSVSTQNENLIQAIEHEFEVAGLLRRQIGLHLDTSDLDGVPAGWDHDQSSDPLQVRQAWEPVAKLRDLCDHIAADFVVALIPSPAITTADGSDLLLGEVTEEFGVPYLDVSADFAGDFSPPLFQPGSEALSPAGHRLFAELLSWAIIHRGHDSSSPEPAAISPAAASVPAGGVSFDKSAEDSSPKPLAVPGRRPRTDTDGWNP